MKKTILVVIILSLCLVLNGCVQQEVEKTNTSISSPVGEQSSMPAIGQTENPRDFNKLIGGVLENADEDVAENFTLMMADLVNGDGKGYGKGFDALSEKVEMKKVSDVVIKGKRSNNIPYRGIFIDSVRELRWSLAHIDRIKAAGIDTFMIDLQLDVYKENGSLYLPGEETYLFYINALHESGFRTWISLATTSYDFPYMWWSNEKRIGIKHLENQEDLLYMLEPEIYKWAEISEKYNVDVFIPGDEVNCFIMDRSYTSTNLCEPERQKLNAWIQKIQPEISKRFSGKVGLATNDGGPCEDHQREGPKRDCPLFNFTGYDFIIQKIPFPSIFNFPDWSWEQGMDSFLNNTLPLVDEYNMKGLIFYEAGDTVGKALEEDFAGSIPVKESTAEEQKISYENDFLTMQKSEKIAGMFFKIAGAQPHEPDWSPFNRPAEQVLQDNFGKYGTLPLTEKDKMWIAIGEDGLKAIQICLEKEMLFDTEYVLESGNFNNLKSKVERICR